MSKIGEKEFNALKDLRNVVYESLSEEDKKKADRVEIENGGMRVAEMLSEMHPSSAAYILQSILEKNPMMIINVSEFSDVLERLFDVYGAEKAAKIVAKAIDILDEKVDCDNEEEKEETDNRLKEEVEKIEDYLKRVGIDAKVEIHEVNIDD
jgi:hypothetical protein